MTARSILFCHFCSCFSILRLSLWVHQIPMRALDIDRCKLIMIWNCNQWLIFCFSQMERMMSVITDYKRKCWFSRDRNTLDLVRNDVLSTVRMGIYDFLNEIGSWTQISILNSSKRIFLDFLNLLLPQKITMNHLNWSEPVFILKKQ